MKTAIYAISGDPITNGHINVINRAAAICDKLIVAIGENQSKQYLFDGLQRIQLVEHAVTHLHNVEVKQFRGMLSDFALSNCASIIIRGVRNSADFEFEQQIHSVGQTQAANLETLLILTDPKLSHISSSTVKGIVKSGGDVSQYVPMHVQSALHTMLLSRQVVGVTGSIACGKSTLCESLTNHYPDMFTNLDLDHVAHQILAGGRNTSMLEKETLHQIYLEFGPSVRTVSVDGSIAIDRATLAKFVFGTENTANKEKLQNILRGAMAVAIREHMDGVKGIVLLNTALLIDQHMLGLCLNKVVMVEASPEVQIRRLVENRHFRLADAKARVESQLDNSQKIKLVNEAIRRDNYGELLVVDSDTMDFTDDTTIHRLANDIIDLARR